MQKVQRCEICDAVTDKCEDDSLFSENGDGPLCEECLDKTEAANPGKEPIDNQTQRGMQDGR